MGKIVSVVGVLIVLVASVFVFFSQREKALTIDDQAHASEPRIVIDDFFVYRYKGGKLIGNFSAKLAHFIEPNIVEAFAAISANRYSQKGQESLRCEAAHVRFNADHMGALLRKKNIKVAYAEVEDQVQLFMKNELLRTEHAQYFGGRDLISSREPVQVDGPNRTFVGEEGFYYNLVTEVIELPGNVKGSIKPADAK